MALVGSSSAMIAGFEASARAISARCFWPSLKRPNCWPASSSTPASRIARSTASARARSGSGFKKDQPRQAPPRTTSTTRAGTFEAKLDRWGT